MGGWGDSAYERNQQDISDYRGGNPAWRHPKFQKKGAWDAPGHDRMFHNGDEDWSDNPNRAFTTRKKHGWWGAEERFDAEGRKIG